VETALRAAVLAAGARVLADLLSGVGCGRREERLICECRETMQSEGREGKTVLTILGEIPFLRSRYRCPKCGRVRYPGDEALDVVDTTRSPGLRRMMARSGSQSTFKEGCEDLRIYAGVSVSPKDVERVAEGIGEEIESWRKREAREILAEQGERRVEKTIPILYAEYDGTGVPMTKTEVAGRKGKQADGSARTREAKLGCVFTQTTTDKEGRPVRDPDSTTFVGAIETAEEFGWRIYAEAMRRGLDQAARVVILGDGAVWILNLAETHFPGAILIVDLYHAKEHVSGLCKLLFHDESDIQRHRLAWWTDMEEGNIEKITGEARTELPRRGKNRKAALTEIGYLEKNRERLRYADFRAQGLFVGSGVVEAGCKTVIGQRLKQSGMEWSVRGANAVIALRCNRLSGRLEDYWESRRAS
jgi:hypothetical protein